MMIMNDELRSEKAMVVYFKYSPGILMETREETTKKP
jgi:hypothetical protein